MSTRADKEPTNGFRDDEDDEDDGYSLVDAVIQQRYPGLTPSTEEGKQAEASSSKGDSMSALAVSSHDEVVSSSETRDYYPKYEQAEDEEEAKELKRSARTDSGTAPNDAAAATTCAATSTMRSTAFAASTLRNTASANAGCPGAFACRTESQVSVLRPSIRRVSVGQEGLRYATEPQLRDLLPDQSPTIAIDSRNLDHPLTINGANSTPHTLVEANPVIEEQREPLPQARPMSSLRKNKPPQNSIYGCPLLPVAFVVLVIVIFVTILLAVASSNSRLRGSRAEQQVHQNGTTAPFVGDLDGSTNNLTGTDSQEPEIDLELEDFLPRHSIHAIQTDPKSPQHLAYLWMKGDSRLCEYSNARRRQRFALATIFYATAGHQWTFVEGWLSYDTHECEWLSKGGYGFEFLPDRQALVDAIWIFTVDFRTLGFAAFEKWDAKVYNATMTTTCDENEEYKDLYLYKNNLDGEMPRELYLLTALQTIDLGFNPAMQGSIGSEIGKLHRLEFLWLGWNDAMTGTLPTEVGTLAQLKLFNLAFTSTTGTIPTELGLLSNLVYLITPTNKLTGSIPLELMRLTDLAFFSVENNALTGTVPSQAGFLTELKMLKLNDNKMTGLLPSELGQLSKLGVVAMMNNGFSGTLPTEIGKWKEAMWVELGHNQWSGHVPLQVGQWVQVQSLLLPNTQLSGSIPSELGLCSNILEMDLSYNNFTGAVPFEFGELAQLTSLDLQANDLTSVPPMLHFGDMGRLTVLHLDNNPFLVGSVESLLMATNSTAVAPSLQECTLANTSLSGKLPSPLCSIEELTYDCSQLLCGCNCTCTIR